MHRVVLNCRITLLFCNLNAFKYCEKRLPSQIIIIIVYNLEVKLKLRKKQKNQFNI